MTTHGVLKEYFGYSSFRPGQESLINSILSGRDVLGIMPTGAGKSICYQVPALLLEGTVIVVSPLISLMKDQVTALNQNGIKSAYINSSLTESQISMALSKARAGEYRLVYVAPERLTSPEFLNFAKNSDISLLTVDEAHCISQWGQDFRPSYNRIPEFAEALAASGKRPVVAAFTATATPRVKEDIGERLALKNPEVLVTGFDRENLYFEVQKRRPKEKFPALLEFLESHNNETGIVYCSTRNNVDEVHTRLLEEGYGASRYHAGLPDTEREANQEAFLHDETRVMVATNAFGMGIDKSNVSFVVHYNMPKDLESYYQEAGRAGRDGSEAECLLMYTPQDLRTQLWLIENGRDTAGDGVGELKERERRRLRDMDDYCNTTSCLRRYILAYFGEKPPNRCGKCGSCRNESEAVDLTVDAQKILSCVARMKSGYGVGMVIQVLRGRTSERIEDLGFHKLSTFGICTRPAKELRDIIRQLIMEGYLLQSEGQYPVIKLENRAKAILTGQETFFMRLADSKTDTLERSAVQPVDQGLMARLKHLRLRIASEQRVPAFTVFSDSALTQMCMLLPKTPEEFLKVAGVGAVKLERYGERFLGEINGFLGGTLQAEPLPMETSRPDGPLTVSGLADILNVELLQMGQKTLAGQHINSWLAEKGYLEITKNEGRSVKRPTDLGRELGIFTEERYIRGEKMQINLFDTNACNFVKEALDEILIFLKRK